MTSMVPVQIVGIRRGSPPGTSAVFLGESEKLFGVLPIVMTAAEVQEVAMLLDGSVVSQADDDLGTHQLTATVMNLAGTRLDEVVVTELRNGVCYAELFVETADGMKSASARASDGVDLAVRLGAPIFVRERVLDSAGVHFERELGGSLSEAEIDDVLETFQAFVEPDSSDDAVGGPWHAHEGRPQEVIGFVDED